MEGRAVRSSDWGLEPRPYNLRVVCHSLGGLLLLIYCTQRARAGRPHHISRLILLSPAGGLVEGVAICGCCCRFIITAAFFPSCRPVLCCGMRPERLMRPEHRAWQLKARHQAGSLALCLCVGASMEVPRGREAFQVALHATFSPNKHLTQQAPHCLPRTNPKLITVRVCVCSSSGFHPVIPSMFKPLVYIWRPLMLWTQLVWRQQVGLREQGARFSRPAALFGGVGYIQLVGYMHKALLAVPMQWCFTALKSPGFQMHAAQRGCMGCDNN